MNIIPTQSVDLSGIITKYFPEALPPSVRVPVSDSEKSFFQRVNDRAMADLGTWVPALLPQAERARDGYRVRSVHLGRTLEEDLSIQPEGIVDFGVHDMGDAREGKRTPLELVMEHHEGAAGVTEASRWLCEQLGVAPAELGWRDTVAEPITEQEFTPLAIAAGSDTDELPGFTRDKKGMIEATIENACKAIAAPQFLGLRVGYDGFQDATMLAPKGTTEWRPLQDADYTELRILMERRDFKPVAKEMVRDAVEYVAARNTFDSAQAWLDTLEWDGVPRIEKFYSEYMGAEDTEYVRATAMYTWSALAGRIVTPGVKADMMPILVGAQGIRKSTGVAAMVPSPQQFCEIDMATKEDDLARRMRGLLIGEVGELRGLHSREIEHIKAFIARQHEKWIPKFKEFAVTFPRRSLLVGTTNRNEFLGDETGERRFLPIMVSRVRVDAIARDRDQLWAEANVRYLREGVVWQMAEDLAKDVHENHKLVDPWRVDIELWLQALEEFNEAETQPLMNGDRPFTMSRLLQEALGFRAKDMQPAHDKRAGAVLRQLGYSSKPKRINGELKKVWVKG